MIITKAEPYTKEEIEKLRELFDIYIKTVVDIKRKICSAGADRHFDSEQILLQQGSKQEDLWGGGIDLETMMIDSNAMINIRPQQGNTSNEIQDAKIREKFENLTKYFLKQYMKNNKFILKSLASDLKRVALGKYRGSNEMASRFLEEALKRKGEVEMKEVAPYIKNILEKINKNVNAEDALMYSTLLQNYTR
ncbi:hypothetical protein HYT33_02365 [Candidatus Roizmanbacteria bacterium]|nr:hypothetical protein [Candidatus Roizmanbacteria bacterium]